MGLCSSPGDGQTLWNIDGWAALGLGPVLWRLSKAL